MAHLPQLFLKVCMANLLIFGAGYSGLAIARLAARAGIDTSVTSRGGIRAEGRAHHRLRMTPAAAIARATHVVSTAAPAPEGDPILAQWGVALRSSGVAWFGYLSNDRRPMAIVRAAG